MNLFQLSWKNLKNKPLATLLSLILFALGVGLISLLLTLNTQVQEKFDNNLAEIDLVIGAKGSPLQLILCSMYHIDNPTGNVSIKEVKPFLRPGHPLIEKAVPLSIGDSHKGYRIIGTTQDILELYGGKFEQGRTWTANMEVVVGATIAKELHIHPGYRFKSSHGLIEDENLVHDDAESFIVVGVLEPSGSVLDQLILTNSQSVWHVHDHDHDHDHDHEGHEGHEEGGHSHDGHGHAHGDHDHDHDHASNVIIPLPSDYQADTIPLWDYEDQDITSLLVKFKGRNFQTLNMGRSINENTDLQAAVPAIEINRLYDMMGVGMDALEWLARIIVLVSGLSIFISLFSSLRDRKYELALMRVMGGSKAKLFTMIILEGLLLAILGYLLGMFLSHFSMWLLGDYMADEYKYSFSALSFLKEEGYLLLGALGIGFVAAFIPAWQASRTDISETLTKA